MDTPEKLQEAIDGTRPVLVEFYADWCPHCQRMMPVVEQLKTEIGDKAAVFQIDGDKAPDLMRKYHARVYPTWIIFKDGEETWRDSGEKPLSELKDIVDKFV